MASTAEMALVCTGNYVLLTRAEGILEALILRRYIHSMVHTQ